MPLFQNQNIFSQFFFCISGIYIKFTILSKKSCASEVISFWNYWLENAELLKCPKSHRVRTLTDSQDFKGSETLLKSAREYFDDLFWTLWKKISSKNSFSEVPEILRLFVIILTPDNKYILSVKASVSRNQFKCNYFKIKIYFLNSFLHFGNLYKIWNTLNQKLSLTGDFLLKVLTGKRGIT